MIQAMRTSDDQAAVLKLPSQVLGFGDLPGLPNALF